MKIQLVSFEQPKHGKKILYFDDDVIDVINSSNADILIFGGGVLKNASSILDMSDKITNHKTVTYIDSKENYANNSGYYCIKDGNIFNLGIHRFYFGTQDTIDNIELATACLDEFFSSRTMTINDKRILLLQGTEVNLFKKAVGEKRVQFCLDSLPDSYTDRWNQLYDEIDIIIQICYKPGKANYKKLTKNLMAQNGKTYFGISNIYNLTSKQGNYVAKEGKELAPVEYISDLCDLWYKSWIYEI